MPDPGDHIPLPPHPYVPGFSPAHARSLFDEIKSSVTSDVPLDRLHETQAFIAGQRFFDAGYFWECHEVLEVIWRRTEDPSPERDMVLALIQLANARLKILMLRPRAGVRLCDMVETHLSRCPSDRPTLGLTVADMSRRVRDARQIAKTVMQSP